MAADLSADESGAPEATGAVAECTRAHLLQQLVELGRRAEARAEAAAAAASAEAEEERRKAVVEAQRERRKASLERVGAYASGVASAISVVSGIITSALFSAMLNPPSVVFSTEADFEASGAACYTVNPASCGHLQLALVYLATIAFITQMATLHQTIRIALGKCSPGGVFAMLALFAISLGCSAFAVLASAWLMMPLHVCIVETLLMTHLALIFIADPLLSIALYLKFLLFEHATLELGRPFGRVRVTSWLHFAASGYVDHNCPYWQPWWDGEDSPSGDGCSTHQAAAAAAAPQPGPGSAAGLLPLPQPPGWQRCLAAAWRSLYMPTLMEHRVFDNIVLILSNLVGPDLNKGGPGGLRPLHLATLAGRSRPVFYLLQAGAKPNVRFAFRPRCGGITPLHLAAARGDVGIAAELLRFGANPGALDYKNQTPADVAAAMEHRAVLDLLEAWVDVFEHAGERHASKLHRHGSDSSRGSLRGAAAVSVSHKELGPSTGALAGEASILVVDEEYFG